MEFYGYNGDDDRYWSAPHRDFEAAPCYSSPYYPGEPNPIPFNYSVSTYSDQISYAPPSYDYYHYSVYQPETNYSCYEPPPLYSQTNFTVSHSNVEFSIPEFEEYDPTPYGGGYDQAMTYGKPLPPSDRICYPRSVPQSDVPENFSFDSIPSPYGKDQDVTPTNPSEPADTKAETGKIIDDGKGREPIDAIPIVEQSDVIPIVEERDVIPIVEYPNYGSQMPYGSGLEGVDLCESLFGYWPCLAKKAQAAQQQRNCCHTFDQDRRVEPWESAADYLFGSPVPYGHDNSHQSLYHSDQISWLQ
ncbi:hypothetical protein AAHA92_29937 [Salvia divinorum]|uniref:Uncharacterized protein n=1 Tax=Salvia divinorum TaxID=28513 RepID=A0ABD1G355_SALDI